MSSVDVWHHHASVTREQRNSKNNHKSVLLWFTGLSGSGKSTLAHAVEEELHQLSCQATVLDGDNVRLGLCSDLGFSEKDRAENIRRIGEVCKLFVNNGEITLAAFISPSSHDRERLKKLVTADDFVEVYVRCPIEMCEIRDVKGIYKRARAGEINNFTGIGAPYDVPDNPDIVVDTDKETLEESVASIMKLLRSKSIIE